jgi:mediator of RNA polymerase II transcription subunit 31
LKLILIMADIRTNDSVPSEYDRLLIELEFVQNLANPTYLHYLATNKYFDDDAFMRFLEYLTYWKEPEYIVLLKFPHCLAFLDAVLNDENFRRSLTFGGPGYRDYIHLQQGMHWMHEARDVYQKSAVGYTSTDENIESTAA